MRFLASLKLAIIVLAAMALLMTTGTVIESKYGADYARLAIYNSPLFLTVEFFLFLNILFAALVRLPPKSRLAGFYITHLGLLAVIFGGFLTMIYGIDGGIELESGNIISLARVQGSALYLRHIGDNELHDGLKTTALPQATDEVFPNQIVKLDHYEFVIEKYLPRARARYKWQASNANAPSRYVTLVLASAYGEQQIELSNTDETSDTATFGPLEITLLPNVKSRCFERAALDARTNFIFSDEHECRLLNEDDSANSHNTNVKKVRLGHSEIDKVRIESHEGEKIFYPDLSTHPIVGKYALDGKASAQLIPISSWNKTPRLVLFEDERWAYGSRGKWTFSDLVLDSPQSFGPKNMRLRFHVESDIRNQTRLTEWRPIPPQKIEATPPRAALLRLNKGSTPFEDDELWVSDQERSVFRSKTGEVFEATLAPPVHRLPFAIRLDEFRLRTDDIGSNAPSSYESAVTVFFSNNAVSQHLIAMNQPLKIGDYTLYQSSYFPSSNGNYGSILTVNADPGRSLKYAGSFLVVTGSLTHFLQRALEKKRKATANVQNDSQLGAHFRTHRDTLLCRS